MKPLSHLVQKLYRRLRLTKDKQKQTGRNNTLLIIRSDAFVVVVVVLFWICFMELSFTQKNLQVDAKK